MDKIVEHSGQYRHYKGKIYNVVATVVDEKNEKLFLYKNNKDDKWWIRPIFNFNEKIEFLGKEVFRFEKVLDPQRFDGLKEFEKIKDSLKKNIVLITKESDESIYTIAKINKVEYPKVFPISKTTEGSYLTDYEIFNRLNVNICEIDGECRYQEYEDNIIIDSQRLCIESDGKEDVKKDVNPCSIDLRINDKDYLKSKKKKLNSYSIAHICTAKSLWKDKKPKKSGNNLEIIIKPHETILTQIYEKICLPYDCAGKIELKSTYSRLSLSMSGGDFCNPGYVGYFPIILTNESNRTIVIHPKEKIFQLMLIKTSGKIIKEYNKLKSFKNSENYDDGTPYSFWRAKNIEDMRKLEGTDKCLEALEKLKCKLRMYENTNTTQMIDRLNDKFLAYCFKKILHGYKVQKDGVVNLVKKFFKIEKRKKYFLYCLAGLIGVPSVLVEITSFIVGENIINRCILIPIIAASIVLGVIGKLLNANKVFCEVKFDLNELE